MNEWSLGNKYGETHGHAGGRKSPTYITWRGMHIRCKNPKSASWPSYGARGVTVCERWDSFENFLADMGPRPEGFTLDRIDRNGHYQPDNCQWLPKEQNVCEGKPIEYRGRLSTVSDLAREFGIRQDTLHFRIFKAGWSIERAVETPAREYKRV